MFQERSFIRRKDLKTGPVLAGRSLHGNLNIPKPDAGQACSTANLKVLVCLPCFDIFGHDDTMLDRATRTGTRREALEPRTWLSIEGVGRAGQGRRPAPPASRFRPATEATAFHRVF